MDNWNNPRTSLPSEGVRIDWMDSSGSVVYNGYRMGNLWFLDSGMYVYYTPTMWRYASKTQQN